MIQFRLHHRDGTFIDLYNKTPGQLSTVTEATQNTSIGGEDVITIVVKSSVVLDLRIGDSIVINSKTYKLNRLPEPKKTGDRMLVYNISMEGSKYDLLRVIFDLTIDTTSGALQDVSSNYLTGNIGLFGRVLIANANRVFAGKWTLGEYPDTEIKTLSFIETDNCLLAVNKIAEEFDTGIQIEESGGFFTLHFRETGDPIPATFRYGLEKGVYELSRQNVSTSNIVTRLKVYGSTRNITHSYRSSRLCLPNKLKSQSFIQEQGPVDAFGIWEGTKLFDDIYPTREGTVSQVEFLTERELEDPPVEPEEGEEITAVNTSFVDSQMDFDLNEKREDGSTVYLLPGLSAKVHFQTGNLAGYEFEVLSYNHSEKKFVLKSFFDERGLAIPSETEPAFQYKDGDTYKLLDIALPQSYVDEAEQKLLQKGQEVYPKVSQPLVQYSLELGPEYLKILYQGAPSTLKPGDLIYVVDEDIEVDKHIKIQSFTRDLLKPYSYSNVIISDTEAESVIARLLGEVNKLNDATESLSRNTSLDMYRNNELLRGQFLSKVRPDTAAERITLKKGGRFGAFRKGIHDGAGAEIDAIGNAELESLIVRSFLEVPELRYNRLTLIGEEIAIGAGGVIESVTPVEYEDNIYTIKLKLEEGELNPFRANDIVKGIYNQGGSFNTSWFNIASIDGPNMEVIVPLGEHVVGGVNYPPTPFMNIARWGNLTDKTRQSLILLSAKTGNITMLEGVNSFKNVDDGKIGYINSQWGKPNGLEFISDFDNLQVYENDSLLYAKTLLYKNLKQVDIDNNVIPTIRERGMWDLHVAKTYPYLYNQDFQDEVWTYEGKYRCLLEGTLQEPSTTSTDWLRVVNIPYEQYLDSNKTFYAKPKEYKKGDRWVLLQDVIIEGVEYKKGQVLEAVYETGTDIDWRLVMLEDEAKTTDGINLLRNYDFRYGLAFWTSGGSLNEFDETVLPEDFYRSSANVIGDEYGYNYAITTENNELIIWDE